MAEHSTSKPVDGAKESKVERAKRDSGYLRGTLAEGLAADTPQFSGSDTQVLKFHGIYQQTDRDTRKEAKQAGESPETMFMVRCKIPGGVLTADQYLALDRLATEVTHNDSLRITTRQGIQFHGVIKGDLKPTLQRINGALVSTLAACGDVERNVMVTPLPLADAAHQALRALAAELADHLAPKTRAYHEIWLNGEQVTDLEQAAPPDEVEPIYGRTYLPRKFKTGLTLADDNLIDVYGQDCGLIAFVEDGRVTGVNVVVGGGLGMTHRKADTFARLASPLGSVAPEHVVDAVRLVVEIFRDFGNRADRRHARLKYVLEERGEAWFRQEFEQRAEFPLQPWRDVPPMGYDDLAGPRELGDGRWAYGVNVANGRVIDDGDERLKTGLRLVAERFRPEVLLTPNQSVVFAGLAAEQVPRVEAVLREHGLTPASEVSALRRFALACPALPTCALALAEAERVMPSVVDDLEAELDALGLADEPLTVRMTGCPNGCARPYTADLAFVGRKPDTYDVYVGGRLAGDRLAEFYAEDVPTAELAASLRPLLLAWARARQGDEGLGDFFQRVWGTGRPRTVLTGAKDDPALERVRAWVDEPVLAAS